MLKYCRHMKSSQMCQATRDAPKHSFAAFLAVFADTKAMLKTIHLVEHSTGGILYVQLIEVLAAQKRKLRFASCFKGVRAL